MTESNTIPVGDAADSGTPFNKATAIFRALREKIQNAIPRSVLLIAGLVCIGYSQYLLEQRPPQGTPNPIAETWNALYKLEIVNYDNVFFALPYFIGGAFLCFLAATPSAWKTNFRNWASTWPLRAAANWKAHATSLIIGTLLFAFLLFQLGRHQFLAIYLVIWLVCIFLFSRFFWKWDRNAAIDLSPGISAVDLFWMAGILILGFSIVSFALNDIPVIMVPDEGNFWETARAIALGDLHPVFFDSGVYTFPVASSIFQGWVLRIFGISFWSWRFSSVVAGLLAVIPLYLLAKEWFGRTAAVVAGVMMVSNPYFISFCRMGYNNSQSLFPVTLCIFFFALAARKGSYFYLCLAGLTAGLGFYSYFAAWIGLVTLCLSLLYLVLVKEIRWNRAIGLVGIILLAWAVVFVPRIAYTASGNNSGGLLYKIFETSFVNNFYGTAYYGEADLTEVAPLIPVGEHDTLFYNPVIYGEMIRRGLIRTFLANFDPFIVSEHFLNTGFAGVITPIFFLVGLALSLRRIRQFRFGLPLLWFVAGMFFLSVFGSFPPRHTHLVAVIPALALISAAGFMAIIESLKEAISTRWKMVASIIGFLIVGSTSVAIIYLGFERYFVRMPLAYPPPFEDVASWLAWKIEEPVHLIYLSETDRPHRVEYLVNTHIAPHTYTSGVINGFSLDTSLPGNEPTVIFIDTQQTQGISLIDNPPDGFHNPIRYRHKDGYIMGYALTNTDIDLNPPVGIADGLNSILNTPVRFVLLAFAILFILSLLFMLRNASSWPRNDILFEIGNDPSKQVQEIGSEPGGNEKVEFHLRIRIPARKRNRPQSSSR